MEALGSREAQALFEQLPKDKRLATLSPAYVVADASRSVDLEPVFICYRETGSFWLHGVHRGRVPGEMWFDLQSPYGYGGPLSSSTDAGFLSRAWADYARWCAESDILAEFVRFHPLTGNWRYYSGEVRDDRRTVAVALEAGSELLAGYLTRCRTAIRKAQAAGVVPIWLSLADHIERFGSYYRDGMAAIGAEDFYLFDDAYFSALADLPGIKLLACHQRGTWLSAGLFLRGADTLEYHLSATTGDGRRMGATNLLLHAAAEWGQAEGLAWLYLGGGTDGREDNPLFFFKAGFSEHHFPFRTGFAIHHRDAYEKLRSKHPETGKPSSRILFYR
jgi:hypothetical protein